MRRSGQPRRRRHGIYHGCPIKGCPADIPSRLLMCRDHWYLVPRELRDEVWRTHREHGVLSAEYSAARDAAIAAVETQLERVW